MYHYNMCPKDFEEEKQKRRVWFPLTGAVSSLHNTKQLESWYNMTVVETSELHRSAEQACRWRTSILSVSTLPQLRGFEARTQRNIVMFTERRGEKTYQTFLALTLTFPDSWKANHSTLKSSWHEFLVNVEFATSFHIITTLCIVCLVAFFVYRNLVP